jgi:hypothetical protein
MLKWYSDATPVADQLPFALPDIAPNGKSRFTFDEFKAYCKTCDTEAQPEDYRAEVIEDGSDLLVLGVFYCEPCNQFNRCGVRCYKDPKYELVLEPCDSWPMPWEKDGPEP